MKKIIAIFIVLLGTVCLKAQTTRILIQDEIKLPKNNVESDLLISNLTSFLDEINLDNESDKWILPTEKLRSIFVLSELKRIKKDKADKKLKIHLKNVMPIKKGKYLVQFSYTDESTLIALFEILATKIDSIYKFSSPLAWNTRKWETLTSDYLTFYYDNGNKNLCEQYLKYSKEFDAMLGNPKKKEIVFYSGSSDNLSNLLRLTGVLYHIDYNGLTWSMTDKHSKEGIVKLFTSRMSNIKNIDPHDAFHGRCSIEIPYSKQNRLMICGGAYLYTGNWNYSWEDIQKKFKSNFDYDENTDWLKEYFAKNNFGDETGKGLFTTQFINALIIQDLENKKDFSVVKKLFTSGNMYKNKDAFFINLENLAGINKKNFNKKIGKLITKAMKGI